MIYHRAPDQGRLFDRALQLPVVRSLVFSESLLIYGLQAWILRARRKDGILLGSNTNWYVYAIVNPLFHLKIASSGNQYPVLYIKKNIKISR